MRIAVAVFVKFIQALVPQRRPSGEMAERAFERAAAQFHAQ